METKTVSPLWFDLRKEYIDDNFDNLLIYLKNGQKDAFWQETINLLIQRVYGLIEELSNRCIFEEVDEGKDTSSKTFNVRLLASFLLTKPHDELSLEAFLALINELGSLTPKFSEQSHIITKELLTKDGISHLGINWDDIISFQPERFAHCVFNNTTFDRLRTKPIIYEQHGTAFLTSNGIYLTSGNCEEGKRLIKSGTDSIKIENYCALKTESSRKLKLSEENDLSAISEFINSFIESQKKKTPSNKKSLYEYSDGDTAIVQVTEIDNQGVLHVKTIDTDFLPICGVIKYELPSLFYYNTNSLYLYFKVGDVLKATVTSISDRTFSIENQLKDFFVQDAKDIYGAGEDMLAKLIDVKPNQHYGWINNSGIAVFTKYTGEYEIGDLAWLHINQYQQQGKYRGKIDAEIENKAEETEEFDEKMYRHECIRAFAESTQTPEKKNDEDFVYMNHFVLKLLFRQFFIYQQTLPKPNDRFRYLANAQVMATLVGDELSASYIKFCTTYLRVLVQFAQGKDFSAVRLEADDEFKTSESALIRLSIVELLQEYGKKENSVTLARAIENFKESRPLISLLARLIQTANSAQGILSDSTINLIKREITKTLSVETENNTDIEDNSSTFLGVESDIVEFKTSMVFPANNNMQPNQKEQTENVFRAVCAFLNSPNGGTVYLGVNDAGHVVGLENDLKYLNYSSLDTYARLCVQDPLIKCFGKDAVDYVKIDSQYEGQILAIKVAPHPYRIVELNGIAYRRMNAESREMSETQKEQLIASRCLKDREKDITRTIFNLQHAMSSKKCVILHGYASSNSGTIADREVEPYEVLPKDGIVICFDREKKATRIFNFSRIRYVEVLKEKNWEYSKLHTHVEVDAFHMHMTGEKSYKIRLQLDLMARNQLIEKYPKTEKDISCNGDENVYIYSTKVYSLQYIGRFYIGLADHIKILDAPELKDFVKDFKEKYL